MLDDLLNAGVIIFNLKNHFIAVNIISCEYCFTVKQKVQK